MSPSNTPSIYSINKNLPIHHVSKIFSNICGIAGIAIYARLRYMFRCRCTCATKGRFGKASIPEEGDQAVRVYKFDDFKRWA